VQAGGGILKRAKETVGKMDQSAELIQALKQISREKGINEDIIFEAIETSLVTACKKNFGSNANNKVMIDRETGNVQVFAQKTVVEKVTDPGLEITWEDARKINIRYGLGDIVDVAVTPRNFGRISAQTAKQVVVQKFREAEREILFNEYISKEREIVTGIVQRKDRRNVIITLGKIDAVLTPSEQIPNESYEFQDRLKVYVQEVRQTTKGPFINVSRTNPELVKRLFEQEVPEIYDGTVEIRSIARDPGSRTKIAVYSRNPNVDPVGACVGQNGYRVNVIVSELNGEKIDVIEWSGIPEKYIAAALSPSDVLSVVTNPDDLTAKIVVPDNKLSLAIGKAGQNAKLAAKLTGWRIDIKSESQSRDMDFVPEESYDAFAGLNGAAREEVDYE
jgi:N utilization substance protein A